MGSKLRRRVWSVDGWRNKRKKDKRGRRWNSLNLVGEFSRGTAVKNRFSALEEEDQIPDLVSSDEEEEVVKTRGGKGEDGEDANIEVEDKEGRKEVIGERGSLSWGYPQIRVEGGDREKRGGSEKGGGEKDLCQVKGGERKVKIRFQVAEVKKPLMAVKRIIECGNRVVFAKSGSYIINDRSGERLALREIGRGGYIMDMNLVGGGKGEITVYSGAEESVCPKDWGNRFRVNEDVPKLKFRGADGSLIRHHGERTVVVTSEGFRRREVKRWSTP